MTPPRNRLRQALVGTFVVLLILAAYVLVLTRGLQSFDAL